METDSIRSSGSNTLVDIWIEGKIRAITVSWEAIGAFLGFDQASEMSDADRCEFVRTHLPLVLTAAKSRLRATSPDADAVVIEAGHLARPDGRSGDKRKGDRRQTQRRKPEGPGHQPEHRRGGDRRQGGRRTKTPKPIGT